MQFEDIAVKNPLAHYRFSQTDFIASQTATAIPVAGGAVTSEIMPFDGFIVGITARITAAVSAGTLTVDAAIGGTGRGINLNIGVAATTSYRTRFPVGQHAFRAGDLLSVTYTSNGSLSPITSDGTVTVWVVFTGVDL